MASSSSWSPSGAIIGLDAGLDHVVAVDGAGQVWVWGDNSSGQLGTGTHKSTAEPQHVRLPTTIKQVVAGQTYTLALSSDGRHLYCWGDNQQGQLGIGTDAIAGSAKPRQVHLHLKPDETVTSIVEGGKCAFALLSSGKVIGWGANEHGQIGRDPGDPVNAILFRPAVIPDLAGVMAIAAGDHQTLALRRDGTVYALGSNRYGQIGPNGPKPTTRAFSFTPVRVTGLPKITRIATGGEHSLALDENGNVWSWGRNAFGQLGHGDIDHLDGAHAVPKKVSGLSDIVSLDGEGPFTLAADRAGNVYAWGYNRHGEVGDGTMADTGSPQLVLRAGALGQPVEVVAGHWSGYAVNPLSGKACAWGRNTFHELRLPGHKLINTRPIKLGELLQAACFVSGTRIRTRRGDVPVEQLRVGDRVETQSGAFRPIRWLGRRALRPAEHAIPSDFWPVRILAGAFGGGLPARDLLLSPGHPVLVAADAEGEGGHLVPIMCLVNGTTVRRVNVEAVTYWHVELDAHDILLAEGLPAESYLDCGDRGFFLENADHALADPDFVVPGLGARCRPVAVDGPAVENERRRLDAAFATRLAAACAWPEAHASAFES